MANRDHSLDDGIIQAAYSEFLAYGFQKASLHKIAEKAGVTTGAIYTRYKNKDALFASLLQDFFETMQVLFAPIAEEYEKAKCSAQPDDILRAINAEEQVYFQLLTEHCNDCTLFFCRSDAVSYTHLDVYKRQVQTVFCNGVEVGVRVIGGWIERYPLAVVFLQLHLGDTGKSNDGDNL